MDDQSGEWVSFRQEELEVISTSGSAISKSCSLTELRLALNVRASTFQSQIKGGIKAKPEKWDNWEGDDCGLQGIVRKRITV